MRLARRILVLASSAALVLLAWTWSRGYVARAIGVRATQQPATAMAAFSELVQLGDAGVPALLNAAVSPDLAVAVPARRQLEVMLSRWAAQSGEPLDQHYHLVISGLIEREPQLTPSGRRWADQIGATTLRLAETARDAVSLELVTKTEELFVLTKNESKVRDYPKPPAVLPLDRTSVSYAPRRVERPATSSLPSAPPELFEQPETIVPTPKPKAVAQIPPRPLAPSAVLAPITEPAVDVDGGTPTVEAIGPSDLAWQKPDGVTPVTPPRRFPGRERRDSTPEANTMPREVKQLLVGSDNDKLRLIEEVLAGRHTRATELLFQLAKDPAPRVRSSAISALGSSSDQQLTYAAWQLALRDEDPQVARLASELQKLLK